MIIATFLSNNVTQYGAFENSAYAAFSFFAAFVASMIYSFAKSDTIKNIIENKFGEYDREHYTSMLTVLQNIVRITTYACFIIGILFIIFMAYELSSSFPKFGILYNLIFSIGILGAPLTALYYIRFAKKLFCAYYVKICTIMYGVITGVLSIKVGFTILEIVTNVDHMDNADFEFHRWYNLGLVLIVIFVIIFNAIVDKKPIKLKK